MNENVNLLFERIEELGWNIEIEGENEYRISKFSPAGKDFGVTIEGEEVEQLTDSIYEAWDSFDVSEETYLWLDNTGHGSNGAPYDMRDLYNDVEECKGMLLELYNKTSR